MLGVLPGIIGLVQATEAMKLLLNIGEPLVGRLMMYDSLAMKFREFRTVKDPACALCSPKATIRELEKSHGEAACAIPTASGSPKREVPQAVPAGKAAPAGSNGGCSL